MRRARTRGLGLATTAVVGSFLAVRSGRSARLDRRAAKALAYPLGPRGDVVVGAYTDLGSVYGIAGLATTLAAAGRGREAGDVALAGGAAWMAAQAAKPLVGRERPYLAEGADRLVAVPAGSSWPSGHVAVASAMAATLTPRLRPRARRGVHAVVAGVAVSRCYVGVHHLTDVIAGWGVGRLTAEVVRAAAGAVHRRRGAPGPRSGEPDGARGRPTEPGPVGRDPVYETDSGRGRPTIER